MKPENAVVVITGASSGIGRATAHDLARHGARLALVARRRDFLKDTAAECRNYGARDVLIVPADMSDKDQVQEVIRQVIDKFERVDVWINNAAVIAFGRFEETPSEDFEKVVQTNLFGYIHAAKAVLPYFHEQGGGILINVASVVADLNQPYTTAYTASKAAIRAFSHSLRQEFLHTPHIHICAVLPSAIDTPIYQTGANYSGKKPRPVKPVFSAEKVAKSIVSVIRRPRRKVIVGWSGWAGKWTKAVLPDSWADWMINHVIRKNHFSDDPAPPSKGNLYQPVNDWHSVDGGWKE